MSPIKPTGGPVRDAFYKDGVIPINFSDSPFWDLGAVMANIEQDIKDNKLKDIIIIQRRDNEEASLKLTWRGTRPMTTALGMMAWASRQLQVDDQ